MDKGAPVECLDRDVMGRLQDSRVNNTAGFNIHVEDLANGCKYLELVALIGFIGLRKGAAGVD